MLFVLFLLTNCALRPDFFYCLFRGSADDLPQKNGIKLKFYFPALSRIRRRSKQSKKKKEKTLLFYFFRPPVWLFQGDLYFFSSAAFAKQRSPRKKFGPAEAIYQLSRQNLAPKLTLYKHIRARNALQTQLIDITSN